MMILQILKNIIKYILRFILNKKFIDTNNLKLINQNNFDYFFGYFNRHISNQESILITSIDKESNQIFLIEYSLDKNLIKEQRPLTVTNYQQANQQQWFDSYTYGYLDAYENELGTYIVSKKSNSKSLFIPYPIQIKCSPSSYISIDYTSFNKNAKDYSYACDGQISKDVNLISFDIIKNTFDTKSLFKIFDVSSHLGIKLNSTAHLNHFLYDKKRNSLIFLFRYYDTKRKEFLMSYDIETKSFKTLIDSEFVSHFSFFNDNKILIYGKHEGVKRYFIFNLKDNSVEDINMLDFIKQDGHPICSKKYIVTDSYPSFSNIQNLYIFDKFSGNHKILNFYHKNTFNPYYRCDLHPSFDVLGKKIFINLLQKNGQRAVGIINLENLLND